MDFTEPDAVLPNGLYYISQGWHFVMGTTGGDRAALLSAIRNSKIRALPSRNMAKQVVALQSNISSYAQSNKDEFKGSTIKIEESHQGPDPARPTFKAKKDPSGTAIAISEDLGVMGVEGCPFNSDAIKANPEKYKGQFVMIRDRKYQLEALGVPEEYLDGHGWHTYTLVENGTPYQLAMFSCMLSKFMSTNPVFANYSILREFNQIHTLIRRVSPDGNALFETKLSCALDRESENPALQLTFKHNINGRNIYADGTMEALRFLRGRTETGKVFSMADTLD